jgi:MoaA/NifB/PqqE/SkfB family radical SAM enzyme
MINKKHINFEITSKCNQKCLYCFNEYRRKDINDLSFDKIKNIFVDLKRKNIKSMLFTGGEPFSRIDMIDIIKLSIQMNFDTSILSNGFKISSLLKNNIEIFKALDRIQISLDTFNKDKLNETRGYNNAYKDAISALEELIKYKINNIEISSVFNYKNKNDILEIAEFAHNNKIKLIVRKIYSEFKKSFIEKEYNEIIFNIEKCYPNVLIKDKFNYVSDDNLTINSEGKYIKQVA